MTDKELLELAAKAAGIDDASWFAENNCIVTAKLPGFRCYWNPLIDDGDALRLAVKLGLTISIDNALGGETEAWRYAEHNLEAREDHNSDPYAATRRAIVSVAAEIGKAMQ